MDSREHTCEEQLESCTPAAVSRTGDGNGADQAVNAANFRDVSEACGITLRPGQIYRSSEVYGCDVVTKFNIKTILDLRGPDKCKSKGNEHCDQTDRSQLCRAHFDSLGVKGPTVHHVDFIPTTVGLCIMAKMPIKIWYKVAKGACLGQDPAKIMCPAVADPGIMGFKELYITLLDKSREGIATALRIFVDPSNFPILVHCVHGKDRTGMIIMLILLLSEVPVQAILADYSRSETLLKESKAKNQLHMAPYLQDDEVIAAQRSNLQAALDHIKTKYGGIANYLTKIGINESERKAIRKNIVQTTKIRSE